MRIIQIVADNELGAKAIKKHIEDSKKLSLIEKKQAEFIGFNQKITSENPLILKIWSSPGKAFERVETKHIEDEIDKALSANGATKDDYHFEVIS